MEDENPFGAVENMLAQVGSLLTDAIIRPETYAYQVAFSPENMNELAEQGWTFTAALPVVAFLMQRKRGASDEAEQMLKEHADGG